MATKRCLACAAVFPANPRVPAQNYCPQAQCQLERRRLWQRQKRRSDHDYQENQRQCQVRWRKSHPDYWQHYRAEHPDYADRNREQQRDRNAARQANRIAKMDAIGRTSPLVSGTYRLSPVERSEIAKMDAWIVKITLLSST
jgi:hypothetical protein